MLILVAGGTGRSGRVLAARAVAAGHHVRALSRSGGPVTPDVESVAADLVTGTGLADALADVEAVVDLSNTEATAYRAASGFFTTATTRLVAAERAAGVRQHLVVSIVGIDRFPTGYYRAKLDQERVATAAAAEAGVLATTARVTQFHDFAAMTHAGRRIGPFLPVPALHLRPVHLDDVADHLLGLLDQPRPGRAPDLSGPQPEELVDMVRRFAARQTRPTRVIPLPLPGVFGRANRDRVLAPTAGRHGTRTFAEWLDAQRPVAEVGVR